MADHFYSTARIRVLEKGLVDYNGLMRIIDAESDKEIAEILSEFGIRAFTDEGSDHILTETTLSQLLKTAYDEVEELNNDDPAVLPWRYPYDCTNVKAAIKCALLGIPSQSLLVELGTVPSDKILEAVNARNFDCLPPNMKVAAEEAYSALSKTRDPQTIDLLLDRACFADMLQVAEKSGSSMIVDWIKVRIDLTNLLTAMRLLRMNHVAAAALEERAFLAGGHMSDIAWIRARQEGLGAIRALLATQARYELAIQALASNALLTELETIADGILIALVSEVKYLSFGTEVSAAFLLTAETVVKNLRIILSGKHAGLDSETIRKRVRIGYA